MASTRYFTKNKERVGKKSGKPRGKYKKRGEISQAVVINQEQEPKKQPKKKEFPNISLSITERFTQFSKVSKNLSFWQTIALFAFFLLILGLSLWQGIGLIQQSFALKQAAANRIALSRDLQLWESIAAKYPGYRDAYFQAAVLAYRLGDREREKTYVDKTLEIDPNFLPGKSLRELQ